MNTQDWSPLRWTGWISVVQGTLKSLLQHHSSKASIFQHSAFFIVQLSYPYMIIGKTIALTRQTFVGKVMSLLFNMLSRLVITFLTRSKRLLMISQEAPKSAQVWHLSSASWSLKRKLTLGSETVRPSSYIAPQWSDEPSNVLEEGETNRFF